MGNSLRTAQIHPHANVHNEASIENFDWTSLLPADAAMDNVDWKTQLPADARQRIVNKITETLTTHLPYAGREGLQELQSISVRFEEKMFTSATSQSEYLRKISVKLLTMENSLHRR